MADRPILFSGPMIRALIEGRKTQTRRILKIRGHKEFSEFGPSNTEGYDWHFRDAEMRWHDYRHADLLKRLRFAVGDRLWVRETWTARMTHGWTIADARSRMCQEEILYKADNGESLDGWWPSIHMPREFSRLTLIVTEVRVERLQDCSEADAVAEGCKGFVSRDGEDGLSPQEEYRDLWDQINGAGAWAQNPWIVAVSFTVHQSNIATLPTQGIGMSGGARPWLIPDAPLMNGSGKRPIPPSRPA